MKSNKIMLALFLALMMLLPAGCGSDGGAGGSSGTR